MRTGIQNEFWYWDCVYRTSMVCQSWDHCGFLFDLRELSRWIDCFTSHVGEHRTVRGLSKFREFPEFLKYPQCSSPRKRKRLCAEPAGVWNRLQGGRNRAPTTTKVAAGLVCSTPLQAPRIGLYTGSLVSLKDALIGWSASDYDAPI